MSKNFESENHNLVFFLIISFSWSWLCWSCWLFPSYLFPTTNNAVLNAFLYIIPNLGVFGPLIAAFILTYKSEKKEGIKILWKKFWNIKIKLKWFLIIVSLFPILYIFSFSILLISGVYIPNLPIYNYFSQPLILIYVVFQFIYGAFGEEFGWRGYILPRFQKKWNSLVSSIILGVIWGFWHLPGFLIPGSMQYGLPFLLYILWITFLSILYTWIFNNTEGNIFGVITFHAMSNVISLFFSISLLIFTNINGGLIIITAIIVVIIYGPKKLVREKKDYSKNVSY